MKLREVNTHNVPRDYDIAVYKTGNRVVVARNFIDAHATIFKRNNAMKIFVDDTDNTVAYILFTVGDGLMLGKSKANSGLSTYSKSVRIALLGHEFKTASLVFKQKVIIDGRTLYKFTVDRKGSEE